MDTNLPSSKRTSPILSGVFSAALSVGAVIWAVSAVSGVASAQTPSRPMVSETVSYADLDLSTEAGAGKLLKRLDLAAQRACGPEPTHSPLMPRVTALYDLCVREAVDVAVLRIGSPIVTAVYNAAPSQDGAVIAAR